MNKHCLEAVRFERDLGVIVDDELKFHRHTTATKKANQNLGIIKKSYQTLDAVSISTLYKAMVRLHLEYANYFNNILCIPRSNKWIISIIIIIIPPGDHFIRVIQKKAETVQQRATKIIPELKDKPYEDRLKTLQLPSLTYRRKGGDMIQMYKIINKLAEKGET